MLEIIIKSGASYLLGSIVGSLVLGRLRGVDIRALGSGNAGSTNALRTQGKVFALGVLLIDLGKGWIATRIIAPQTWPPALESTWHAWAAAACGTAVMLGHVYPLWHGFRGGKAVATLFGAALGIAPRLLLPMLVGWCLIAVLTGFVGLASIGAGAIFALCAAWERLPLPTLAFAGFAAALVILTHRKNIARMRAGCEPRARHLWLLGRRAAP
jgi:glycerol-3-phosphate acyltransferase PlsY